MATSSAATTTNEEILLEFVKKDTRRMLHVVYRVGDLDKTIKYTSLSLPPYHKPCVSITFRLGFFAHFVVSACASGSKQNVWGWSF